MAPMQRLAVCGWDDDSPTLLQRLEQRAELRAVAVGARHTAELVRARSSTGLPCFQHVLEMLRVADYEAVLIDCDLHAGEIAELAAQRDADLIVSGERLDAASLAAVARAATLHSVALVVLRPALRDRGYAFVTELVAADPRWQPSFVGLELSGDRPAEALLRDAVAAMTRLLPQTPFQLSAAIAGPPDAPEAMVVQIRLPGGALALLTARVAPVAKLSLAATSPAGSAELSSEGGEALVTLAARGAAPERSRLAIGDPLDQEAVRVAAVRRGEALDALLAPREAATLEAIEAALATGEVQPVHDPTPRASLRVLQGGGHRVDAPAGRLTLISG